MESKKKPLTTASEPRESLRVASIVLRVLKYRFGWLPIICRNPSLLKTRYKFNEATEVRDFFETCQVFEFILQNFYEMPLIDFVKEFLRRIGLFLDEKTIIAEEVREINAQNASLSRGSKRLPLEDYSYADKHGNVLEVYYNLRLGDYRACFRFYSLILVTCASGHATSFSVGKSRLTLNLKTGEKYRVVCPICKQEFELSPDLRSIKARPVKNSVVNGPANYFCVDPLKKLPVSLFSQLCSKQGPEKTVPNKTQVSTSQKLSTTQEFSTTQKINLTPSSLSEEDFDGYSYRSLVGAISRGEHTIETFLVQANRFIEVGGKSFASGQLTLSSLFEKLALVAGKYLDFHSYCWVVNYFCIWNGDYAKEFSKVTAPRVFEEAILSKKENNSYTNFKVKSPRDFKSKLATFNETVYLPNRVAFKYVLRASIKDFIAQKISENDLDSVCNLIIDCARPSSKKANLCRLIGRLLDSFSLEQKARYYFRSSDNYV